MRRPHPLAIVLSLLLWAGIIFGISLIARAGGYCQEGYKECDTTTTSVTTTTTSTTTSSSTTTTIPDTTTTTLPVTSTTASPTTTTTSPTSSLPLVSVWEASSHCDTLTATWGEGIVQVDVWFRDPVYGDYGPADGLVPFTVSGQVLEVGFAGEFILLPVVTTGYTADPIERVLFTSVCEAPSTSVSPTVPPSTLPFTGPFEGWSVLGMSGVALLVLGWLLIKAGREDT